MVGRIGMGRRARGGGGAGVRLGMMALLWLAWIPEGHGELRRDALVIFPLQEGVVIDMDTVEQSSALARTLTRVRIDAFWGDGLAMEVSIFAPGGEQVLGTWSEVADLASCGALDPWWPGVERVQWERCELWLSGAVREALAAQGQAWFRVDVTERRDVKVLLTLERHDRYGCRVDGQWRELPAWVLRSNKGDELWVLDDAANPFVLEVTVGGIYGMAVTDIWVGLAPPPPAEVPPRGQH